MTPLPVGTRVAGEAEVVIEEIEAEVVVVVVEAGGTGEDEDAATKEDGGVGSVRVGARLPRGRGRSRRGIWIRVCGTSDRGRLRVSARWRRR